MQFRYNNRTVFLDCNASFAIDTFTGVMRLSSEIWSYQLFGVSGEGPFYNSETNNPNGFSSFSQAVNDAFKQITQQNLQGAILTDIDPSGFAPFPYET